MKKVLFPILALVLAIGLFLPMAAPVTATINTQVIDPPWEVTNNSMVDPTIASALPWTDSAWGGWNPNAWPGPSTGIYGHSISYWVQDDTWMNWLHSGSNYVDFTHRWFHTTVNIPSGWTVTAVNLVYKYNDNILPINDDLYVYVDGTYCAAGGTAKKVTFTPPQTPPDPTPYGTFTDATGIDWATAPETGWYMNGGLSLPASLFTTGSHEIHVLAEEFDTSGGLGHMVFKVTYEVPEIEKKLLDGPDEIGIYLPEPTEYVFEIAYGGPAAKVIDTVPAEFDVVGLVASDGTAISFRTGHGGTKGASRIVWDVPAGSNTLTVTIQTVASPGKGHKDPVLVFKPTSCGPLPLNDGATAYEVDEFGDLVLVEVVDPDTGEITLEPVVIVGPSNALVVEAVAGAKPCGDG